LRETKERKTTGAPKEKEERDLKGRGISELTWDWADDIYSCNFIEGL
jgi:hypothetical protein